MELIKVLQTNGEESTRYTSVKLISDGVEEEIKSTKRMGWIPDLPDVRDYTPEHDVLKPEEEQKGEEATIKTLLNSIGISGPETVLPQSIHLSRWFSPIEDQKNLESCTAQAGVALLEYYERRAFGKHIDASRYFCIRLPVTCCTGRGIQALTSEPP